MVIILMVDLVINIHVLGLIVDYLLIYLLLTILHVDVDVRISYLLSLVATAVDCTYTGSGDDVDTQVI